MKRILIALTLITATSVAAMAGDYTFSTPDSHGPRQPNPYTADSYTGQPVTATAAPQTAKPTWAAEPWSYQASSPLGYAEPRSADLTEQLAINEAHKQRSVEQLYENGGCNADIVPYGYAVDCSAFLVNNAPFGGADNGQMGSQGD